MTRENRLALLKGRLAKLKGTPKNVKCPGCIRKLERQVRRLENE